MAKSIIVYGPDLDQMRKYQFHMSEHFGATMVTEHRNGPITMQGSVALLFTTHEQAAKQRAAVLGIRSASFEEVAAEYNAKIPLTDWQSGPPPVVGEWIANVIRDDDRRRWWNGESWSVWYSLHDDNTEVARCQGKGAAFAVYEIEWRGLSSEPIKVTE